MSKRAAADKGRRGGSREGRHMDDYLQLHAEDNVFEKHERHDHALRNGES